LGPPWDRGVGEGGLDPLPLTINILGQNSEWFLKLLCCKNGNTDTTPMAGEAGRMKGEQMSSEILDDLFDPETEETPLRPREHIERLEDFYYKRVWYERHFCLTDAIRRGEFVAPPHWARAVEAGKKAKKKLEDEGKALGIDPVFPEQFKGTPEEYVFEYGMINGKLSALRWVLGSHMDMLDT
jgi:hypothetical protein